MPSEEEIIGLLSRYGLGIRRTAAGPLEVFGPATTVESGLQPRWSDEVGVAYSMLIGKSWYGLASASRRTLKDDLVLAACSHTACIGNPGRGALRSIATERGSTAVVPRPRRESEIVRVEFGTRGSTEIHARYMHARHRGNTEPRMFPDTLFTVDPYIDLRRAFGDFQIVDDGPLHTDRRHQASLSAEHRLGFVDLALLATWQSGAPISRYGVSDRFATYPHLLGPHGSAGRTPSAYELSVSADYAVEIAGIDLHIQLSALNLLNTQTPLLVDERWSFREMDNASPTPANPHFGEPIVRSPPRTIAVAFKIGY